MTTQEVADREAIKVTATLRAHEGEKLIQRQFWA